MTMLWKTAGALARGVWRKTSSWRRSSRFMQGRNQLAISPTIVQGLRRTVRMEQTRNENEELDPEYRRTANSNLSHADKKIAQIVRETTIWNQNNVTRTQAYWNICQDHPELHWALLAHMVSRNSGWAMTDLKGEWLPKLLPAEIAEAHFELLETCNALIFRDAYPQLRLYTESLQSGAPLFRLLPEFGVSAFMPPIWERFWELQQLRNAKAGSTQPMEARSASALITVALIVNEQHVIEEPVIRNPHYRDRVLSSASFRMMPLMQTNQIVFPMLSTGKHDRKLPLRLVGKVLENFADLQERIAFGKCLYAMLFGYPIVRERVAAFAKEHPHTGSRADYWPQRFCAAPNRIGGPHSPRVDCAGRRWHSPALTSVWPDRPLPELPLRDWFRADGGQDAFAWLTSPKPPLIFDMTDEHMLGQRKFQAATQLAAEASSDEETT